MIPDDYKKYILIFFLCTVSFIIFIFLINYVVDPLWYDKGNLLFNQNYAFNERLSKTNLFLSNPLNYDCIIFGSSRTTLLNSDKIQGHRCFNFSFSGGLLNEFEYYAKYIDKWGVRPDLAIIAIDSFSFYRNNDPLKSIPEFILTLEKPPGILKSYLSLDTLFFSIRTLLKNSPYPRYYKNDFHADILLGTPLYREPDCITIDPNSKKFDRLNVESLKNLRESWPETKFVGYVSPISAWDISALYYDGTLDSYLSVIYQTKYYLDSLFDFSIPSCITMNPDNSYDSEHYCFKTTNLIAESINNDQAEFGLNLKALSEDQYKAQFLKAIKHFTSTHQIKLGTLENCAMRTQTR